MKHLQTQDPEIYKAIQGELSRQTDELELIASENYTSPAVMEAQGSILTNKYAEGYPGRRYYGGCHYVDISESLAIERAKSLFQADCANVQPHSGSQANMAVFFAELQPGDKLMGLDLSHGGHLTHGSKVNFSGFLYESVFYTLDPKTERLDYDRIAHKAKKEHPKIIVAGFSSYPRLIDFKAFRDIADSVGAKLLVDMAHIAGLVAAGLHPSPVPFAHYVTSTTHKTLRGPRGGLILGSDNFKAVNSKIFPGIQGGPLEHVIAAKAVAFKEAQSESFKAYAKQIIANAKSLANCLKTQNLRLISGGTDNHLILVDVSSTNITGRQAETILSEAGITVNKNAIPGETLSPFVTSGIRLGTAALTTRGMKTDEMDQIGQWIGAVLSQPDNPSLREQIKAEVKALCDRFPLYPNESQ